MSQFHDKLSNTSSKQQKQTGKITAVHFYSKHAGYRVEMMRRTKEQSQ